MDDATERGARPQGMLREGADAVPPPPPPSPDDRPSAASTVRVIATPCALLVLGAVFFIMGWVVAGVVACVLAVLVTLLEVAIGWVGVKYALRDHANVFRLIASLLRHDGARPPARQAKEDTPEREQAERSVDRAVGFGLTRAAAADATSISDEGKTPEDRARLFANVMAERAATYTWLQAAGPWERVSIGADDGVELVGQVLHTEPPTDRWAVLCHGYGGTWDSMLQYTRHWSEAGYSLLVPHMRAHGESGGPYIGVGWLDRRDVVAWARWLSEGGAGPCRDIVLFGHSMGASSVCMATGEADLPPTVSCAVGDCGFDSGWHALSSTLQAAEAPVHPTLDLVRLYLMTRRGGYDLAKADVTAALAHSSTPTLFVHGLADPTVAPSMAGVLYRACAAEPKRLVAVPGAGHCQSSLMDPAGYWDAVLGFARACRPRGTTS